MIAIIEKTVRIVTVPEVLIGEIAKTIAVSFVIVRQIVFLIFVDCVGFGEIFSP